MFAGGEMCRGMFVSREVPTVHFSPRGALLLLLLRKGFRFAEMISLLQLAIRVGTGF